MAINSSFTLLNTFQTGSLMQSASAAQTAASVSVASDVFELSSDQRWVTWNKNTRPDKIAYKGNIYEYEKTQDDGTLRYYAINANKLPQGSRRLRISFTGDTRKAVIGYETERVQVGTEQVQIGTEQVQVGTKQVQTGTELVITGYNQVQTGTEQVQVGTESVLTGYKQVQVGTEQFLKGYEQVQVGTEQVQVGTEQVQVGTEQVQVGERIVGYNTITEQVSLKLSRELDGRENAGAIGDMLNRGTQQLSDANQFFSGDKFNIYKVSNLLGEDNQAISGEIDPLSDIKCADDMYVAGDPLVGGKGNNYAPVDVNPQTGYLTMFEDGADNGRKITINAHADIINPDGNKAFTEYGFVIQDDNLEKTKAVLSGGKLTITAPNGQTRTLLPGEEYVIGNSADPTAKFYYASVPGGENGANEQRLIFESYEKPSQAVIDELVAKGMDPVQAAAYRAKTQASFGFRVPDGQGSYRMSAGVGAGNALSTTSNGVKTYYDAHFNEANCQDICFDKVTYEPIKEPVYENRPIYGERPVYEQRPVYENRPIYGERPVYEQRPVYENRPVYEDRPVYEQCPVYEERPVYEDRPIYEQCPIYEERPVYEECPIYEERPIYKEKPVYEDRQKPIYGKEYKIKPSLASPLVLDLDGDGITTTDVSKVIDIDGDGILDKSAWFGPREGVLAFDANRNGRIDLNGLELFGNHSDVDGDGKPDNHENGFDALKAFAARHLGQAAVADNQLDAAELQALENQAGLRMVVGNQVHKVSSFGINQINLNYQETNIQDQFGNETRQVSSFKRTLSNGQTVTRDINDIWLVNTPMDTQPQSVNKPAQSRAPQQQQPMAFGNLFQQLFNLFQQLLMQMSRM